MASTRARQRANDRTIVPRRCPATKMTREDVRGGQAVDDVGDDANGARCRARRRGGHSDVVEQPDPGYGQVTRNDQAGRYRGEQWSAS